MKQKNHFDETLLKSHYKNMFVSNSYIKTYKNYKKTAGMLVTEVRTGDAPKPTFSLKTDDQSTKLRKSIPDQCAALAKRDAVIPDFGTTLILLPP